MWKVLKGYKIVVFFWIFLLMLCLLNICENFYLREGCEDDMGFFFVVLFGKLLIIIMVVFVINF